MEWTLIKISTYFCYTAKDTTEAATAVMTSTSETDSKQVGYHIYLHD